LVSLAPLENNLIVSLGIYPGMDTAPIEDTTTTTSTSTDASTTTETSIHRCMVANIPIQKWVNILISTYGRSLDIYIDGKLVRTCVLPGVARIESSTPVYITPNGGFSGWTAKFQYWPESCDPQKAWNIYKAGYGASMLAGLLGKYTVKVSLMEGDVEENSFSI